MSDYWGDDEQPVCPILERSMAIAIEGELELELELEEQPKSRPDVGYCRAIKKCFCRGTSKRQNLRKKKFPNPLFRLTNQLAKQIHFNA